MTTINRTKLLEYLDEVIDEELDLASLTRFCLTDTGSVNSNTPHTTQKRKYYATKHKP